MEESKVNKLRGDSWDNSFHCFGTAYIFTKRALKFSRYVNLLKVFGIIVPVLIGATASGYGFDSIILKWTIFLTIPVGIIQLIVSVLAVIYKWDEELAYSYEASKDHNNLFQEFKSLANIPNENEQDLLRKLEILKTKKNLREEQDNKHNIKEIELRMGMKSALREFQRKCLGCETIPLSMESTDCKICGNF